MMELGWIGQFKLERAGRGVGAGHVRKSRLVSQLAMWRSRRSVKKG